MKIINRKRGEANRAEERKEFAGKAQMPEAKFTASLIKGSKDVFRPSTDIKGNVEKPEIRKGIYSFGDNKISINQQIQYEYLK